MSNLRTDDLLGHASPMRVTYRNLNRIRQWAQVLALLLLVAVPVLNWLGVHWIVGTLYSISIGEWDIADPMMALQALLLTRKVYFPLLIAAAAPVLIAFVFGRVFCSWVCPYNTLLEWLDRLKRRFSKRRWLRALRERPVKNPHRAVYWSIFSALVLLALVAGLPLLGYLSAPGILSSQLAQGILGMGVGLDIVIVASLLVAEVTLARRFWCKYVCPVGATLSLFRTRRTLHIEFDAPRCTCESGAQPCHLVCPFGLAPRLGDIYPYCYNCGSCLAACETTQGNALRFSFAKEYGTGERQVANARDAEAPGRVSEAAEDGEGPRRFLSAASAEQGLKA